EPSSKRAAWQATAGCVSCVSPRGEWSERPSSRSLSRKRLAQQRRGIRGHGLLHRLHRLTIARGAKLRDIGLSEALVLAGERGRERHVRDRLLLDERLQ